MERLIDLYKAAWQKYACFEGRACRAEACAFYLINILIAFVSYILFVIFTIIAAAAENVAFGILAAIVIIFLIVFALATLVPTYSLGARRCHDFNMTGWLQLLVLVAGGIFTIIIMCIPGTEGNNQYGPQSEKF